MFVHFLYSQIVRGISLEWRFQVRVLLCATIDIQLPSLSFQLHRFLVVKIVHFFVVHENRRSVAVGAQCGLALEALQITRAKYARRGLLSCLCARFLSFFLTFLCFFSLFGFIVKFSKVVDNNWDGQCHDQHAADSTASTYVQKKCCFRNKMMLRVCQRETMVWAKLPCRHGR